MPYERIDVSTVKDETEREILKRADALLGDVYTMCCTHPIKKTNAGSCLFSAALVLLSIVDALASHIYEDTKKFKKKSMQKKRFCTLIIDKLEWRDVWMGKKKAADLLYIDFRNPLTHDLGKDPRPGFEGLKEPTLGIWGNVKPKRVAAVDARKKWPDDWPTLTIISDAQGRRYKLTVIALYWGVKKMVKDFVKQLS